MENRRNLWDSQIIQGNSKSMRRSVDIRGLRTTVGEGAEGGMLKKAKQKPRSGGGGGEIMKWGPLRGLEASSVHTSF